MFKNKEGLFRSGWKVALVFTIIFGLTNLEGSLFDYFATIHVTALGGSQDEMYKAYEALYSQWEGILFFVKEIMIIAVSIIAWKVLSKRKLEDMGLGCFREYKKDLGAGLLLGIVLMTLTFFVILLTGSGFVETWVPQFTINTVIYLAAFVLVGFAEEILARGYFMSALRQTKSMPLIVSVSAVLFSLMHMMNNAFSVIPFINIVLVGLLFAYMYIKSGSIWMPIGFHITWNYFQGNVYGFSVSGMKSDGLITTQLASDNILNGGAFGPEGGLIVTAVIILGFVFTKWYYKDNMFNFLDMDTPVALKALYHKICSDNN